MSIFSKYFFCIYGYVASEYIYVFYFIIQINDLYLCHFIFMWAVVVKLLLNAVRVQRPIFLPRLRSHLTSPVGLLL